MAATFVQGHARFLRLARQTKGAIESMQDVGVVGVAGVFVVRLPVGVNALRVVTQHLEWFVQHAANALRHLAQPVFQGLDLVRKRREHQATQGGDAQFLKAVLGQLKVFG